MSSSRARRLAERNRRAEFDETFASTIGASLLGVRRVRFLFHGQRDAESDGPLELAFSNNEFVTIRSGANGSSLFFARGRWKDPFAEPLSQINREFVESHGQWSATDVSTEPPYSTLIDDEVVSCEPTWDSAIPDISALALRTAQDHRLDAVVDGDGLWVSVDGRAVL